MQHTFELSGLGKAPFNVVSPFVHAMEKDGVFWCEHCGRMIKNRYFVKSSDGVLSVIGVDCLKKTGDQGLIDGVRRLKREIEAAEREEKIKASQGQRESEQRAKNNGLTNDELIAQLQKEADDISREVAISMDDNAVVQSLSGPGFEGSMYMQAYTCQPYTPNQARIVAEILAKKRSGSNRNTAKYKAVFPECEAAVCELNILLSNQRGKIEDIKNKIRHLMVDQ